MQQLGEIETSLTPRRSPARNFAFSSETPWGPETRALVLAAAAVAALLLFDVITTSGWIHRILYLVPLAMLIREQAACSVRRSEARYRALVAITSQVVWICDPDGRVVEDIPSWRAFTGQSFEESRTWGWLNALHPEDRERTQATWAHAVKSRTPYQNEYRLRRHDGEYRYFEGRAAPVLDAAGRVREWAGISNDITERRRSEQRTRALLDVAGGISGTLDHDELLRRVQQHAVSILPCDVVVTFHHDPASGTSRALAQLGVENELLPSALALELRLDREWGRCLHNGEPLFFNDTSELSATCKRLVERCGIKAMIAAPLRVCDHHFGTLLIARVHNAHPFQADDIDLCMGIARQLGVALQSAELYRAQHEEAAVSGALAQIGKELIASLGTERLLDRLCTVTAQALDCDGSYTLMWQPTAQAYVIAGEHGCADEGDESLRRLRIPAEAVSGLLAAFSEQDSVQIDMDAAPTAWATLPAQCGFTHVMYIPLRRGQETIGILGAGFRGRHKTFSGHRQRIAHGLAHLAALALEDARLFEDLQHANRLKSDFVATMSHELRTPMTVIMGYNDLILDGAFGTLNPEQVPPLQLVGDSARQLLELISATLDISRVESGRLPLQLDEVDMASFIRVLSDEMQHLENNPTVSLTWAVAANLPPLHTDTLKIKIILKNLIGNAMKFTPAGTVSVTVSARNNGVQVQVADTGIGMSPDGLGIIFEPFRQLDGAKVRNPGVGLGLYLVRRLLDLLGGTITVESEIGKGSVFRVWLPDTTGPREQLPASEASLARCA